MIVSILGNSESSQTKGKTLTLALRTTLMEGLTAFYKQVIDSCSVVHLCIQVIGKTDTQMN